MAFLIQSLRMVRAPTEDADLLPPCFPPALQQERLDPLRPADAASRSVAAVTRSHGRAEGIERAATLVEARR